MEFIYNKINGKIFQKKKILYKHTKHIQVYKQKKMSRYNKKIHKYNNIHNSIKKS